MMATHLSSERADPAIPPTDSFRILHSMLDCLGQGFLTFDRTGLCAPIYSRACETLLETDPTGKPVTEVLRMDGSQKARFASLMKLAFGGEHAVRFEEIMRFAPRIYPHSEGRHITLDYRAEFAANGAIEHIFVVATDRTEEVRAQALVEERKNTFESVERVLHDMQGFGACMRRILELVDLMSSGRWAQDGIAMLREVHTLKSGAGAFRLTQMVNILHDFESALKPDMLQGMVVPAVTQTVAKYRTLIMQEAIGVADHFKELLGIDALQTDVEGNFKKKAVYGFAGYLAAKGLDEARTEYIRKVCAESLQASLRRYDTQLSDLAERFDKKIYPIWFTGDDIPFLSGPYQRMLDSFVHIFRNILDHGIEPPDDRATKGKDETGAIEIKMALQNRPEGGQMMHLEIRDDGAGIDVPKLRLKLVHKEPAAGWDTRPDQDVIDRIFVDNLSTRDTVTQYSGRGIGMSSVYHEIKRLKGKIAVRSTAGQGTQFIIDVPYIMEL